MNKIQEILLNKELTIEDYNYIIEFSNKKIKELEQRKYLDKLLHRFENFCEFKEPCELLYLFKTINIINLNTHNEKHSKKFTIEFKFINIDNIEYNIKMYYYVNFCKKNTEFEYFHEILINSEKYENFAEIIKLFNWNYVSSSELKFVFTEMFKIFDSVDFIMW